MPESVGFIGLGAMGAEMARNLERAGYALRVCNRTPARSQPFEDSGAVVCRSPGEVAEGAVAVVSMVADDVASRAVMLGRDGVINQGRPGLLVLDCSTNTPRLAREVAVAAAARGIDYLDAPVSGSIAQAHGRELMFMIGGAPAAIARATPYCEVMGRTVRHIGPSGSGATVKLISNMLSGTLSAALAESIAVAEAAGLDAQTTLEVLCEGATGSRLVRSKVPKMTGRDFKPQFQLALMDKDLDYFLKLARDVKQPAPIGTLVRSQYEAACQSDLGQLDVAALFLHVTGRKP